ncbi:MAG: methionyl-tRNA formyltransferase [Synergistaceae bacterium]|nr:methionyl-tRNA formyltransferase [Synergistaceae bacterium]MBR0035538.1 methionyl-tRNA formyltransferase [Synergistaceae bacterium]
MSNNIWFIGTGKFAALCLENLIRKNIPLHRIITSLPTRSGRNNRENPSAVELAASVLGLNVERTGRLSDNQQLIHELADDDPAIIFVIDFGQIVREPFLSRMCLNIHPSLLPEYRGAAPVQRALLEGRAFTGVSVFRLAKAMDAGEVFGQVRTEILPDENASDLYKRLAEMGCEIAAEALKNPYALTFTPQDESLATYAPKLGKADFELLFSMPAKKFTDSVRALDMSGGAFTVIRGKRVKIWRAVMLEDIKAKIHGQILECSGNPVVSCEDFGVELAEVQSEGKNRVTGSEWMRGLRLKCGDIL